MGSNRDSVFHLERTSEVSSQTLARASLISSVKKNKLKKNSSENVIRSLSLTDHNPNQRDSDERNTEVTRRGSPCSGKGWIW